MTKRTAFPAAPPKQDPPDPAAAFADLVGRRLDELSDALQAIADLSPPPMHSPEALPALRLLRRRLGLPDGLASENALANAVDNLVLPLERRLREAVRHKVSHLIYFSEKEADRAARLGVPDLIHSDDERVSIALRGYAAIPGQTGTSGRCLVPSRVSPDHPARPQLLALLERGSFPGEYGASLVCWPPRRGWYTLTELERETADFARTLAEYKAKVARDKELEDRIRQNNRPWHERELERLQAVAEQHEAEIARLKALAAEKDGDK